MSGGKDLKVTSLRPDAEIERKVSEQFKGVFAEYLFAVLPLVVLWIVFSYKQQGVGKLLSSADWSFGAAVLIGQAIVKLVSGLAAAGGRRRWERAALIVSSLIVLLLVPSLVILALMLIEQSPPLWLVIAQILLFVAGSLVFLCFGSVGQHFLDRTEK